MAVHQESSDSEVELNFNNHASGDEEDYRGEIGDHDYRAPERRRRNRPPQIKPDPFTGMEDWDQYFSYFEDCAELAQWSEKEKLLYLATSLKQQARLHYSSLPVQDKRSYKALVSKLEQRFGSKRQQTRWLSKMQNRTRVKNESIAVFGDELRLLACKAYANLDPEAQEMLALQHFYKNVSAELRCRLMDKDCKTISEAVEVVERYEDVLGQMNTNNSAGSSRVRGVSGTVGQDSTDSRIGSQKEFEDIKGAIKRIEGRLDKLESNTSSRKRNTERTCFSCGASDHFFKSCPNKGKYGNNPPRNQGNSNLSSR